MTRCSSPARFSAPLVWKADAPPPCNTVSVQANYCSSHPSHLHAHADPGDPHAHVAAQPVGVKGAWVGFDGHLQATRRRGAHSLMRVRQPGGVKGARVRLDGHLRAEVWDSG